MTLDSLNSPLSFGTVYPTLIDNRASFASLRYFSKCLTLLLLLTYELRCEVFDPIDW